MPSASAASSSARKAFNFSPAASSTSRPTEPTAHSRSVPLCALIEKLNAQSPRAGSYGPALAGRTLINHPTLTVQRDRRTDVPRDAMQALADVKLVRPRGFNNQMFFTVHHFESLR